MQKKLTLSINEDLIKFAHKFSEETNQSISHIVEEYLNELKEQETKPNNKHLNHKIEKLYGAFENEPIPDKKDLRRRFHEKNHN
jgi:ribosome recycling factor